MSRSWWFAALVTFSWAAPAGAQHTAEDMARAHFESGRMFYESARYADAARAFLESYELSPRPELLENASRAYERALMFDDAIEMLRRMQRQHAGHIDDAVLRTRIAGLEDLRARVGNGQAPPAGDPAAVDPGQGAASGGPVSIPGIVVLAAGGAIGLGSIITGAVAHTIHEELVASCPNGVCDPSRRGDAETGSALAITSTVFMFTSIAAIGVGIVLMILDTGGGADDRAARLVPGPGDAGAAIAVRF